MGLKRVFFFIFGVKLLNGVNIDSYLMCNSLPVLMINGFQFPIFEGYKWVVFFIMLEGDYN